MYLAPVAGGFWSGCGGDRCPRRQGSARLPDEFSALGRLDFFESALAFMAGYGLKGFLIAQSLNQIEKAYGLNHSWVSTTIGHSFGLNTSQNGARLVWGRHPIAVITRLRWPKIHEQNAGKALRLTLSRRRSKPKALARADTLAIAKSMPICRFT